MTPPIFTPIVDPLYALCPECAAMETLDETTKRCRSCWRAWRWSPVGWVMEQARAGADPKTAWVRACKAMGDTCPVCHRRWEEEDCGLTHTAIARTRKENP